VKLRKVKPSLIKWPEERVTSVFDEETAALLSALVKELGVISPVIVQEIEGEIVGVDGYHRAQEAIKLGDSPVDVAIIEGDMVDLLCRNLVMDRARGRHTPGQMVRLIKTLYEKYKLDSEQIEKRSGFPRDYVERYIKISLASPSVMEALDQGVIGVGHAYELARLPFPVQQEEVIAKHQVWRFSVKELHDQVDQVLAAMQAAKEQPQPGQPAAPKVAPIYKCEGCHEVVEARYLRPVMVCPDCFGEIWRLGKSKKTNEASPPESRGGG